MHASQPVTINMYDWIYIQAEIVGYDSKKGLAMFHPILELTPNSFLLSHHIIIQGMVTYVVFATFL